MTDITQNRLIARRGELLAELSLQELNPFFVARNTREELGIDFFVGFKNEKGGMNVVAVEMKATEHLPGNRIQIPGGTYQLLANSNIPGLLLVVDVKMSKCYYAQILPSKGNSAKERVSVVVEEMTETSRARLIKQFSELS